MGKCCVCGKELEDTASAVLFVGEDEKEKLICNDCNKRADDLFEGTNERKKAEAANYFAAYAEQVRDAEVRDFLSQAISDRGFMDVDEVIADPDEVESGAASLLKICAYVVAGVTILSSIVTGVVLGAFVGGFAGFVAAINGIVCAVMIASFCLVFLGMAKDAQATRNLLQSFIQKYEAQHSAAGGRKRSVVKSK